jgi:hypothetical protein
MVSSNRISTGTGAVRTASPRSYQQIDRADLARRGNQVAAEPHRDGLERLLVPEAWP